MLVSPCWFPPFVKTVSKTDQYTKKKTVSNLCTLMDRVNMQQPLQWTLEFQVLLSLAGSKCQALLVIPRRFSPIGMETLNFSSMLSYTAKWTFSVLITSGNSILFCQQGKD